MLINYDGHTCEGYIYLLVLDLSKCRQAFCISYSMPTLGEMMDRWINEAAVRRKAKVPMIIMRLQEENGYGREQDNTLPGIYCL